MLETVAAQRYATLEGSVSSVLPTRSAERGPVSHCLVNVSHLAPATESATAVTVPFVLRLAIVSNARPTVIVAVISAVPFRVFVVTARRMPNATPTKFATSMPLSAKSAPSTPTVRRPTTVPPTMSVADAEERFAHRRSERVGVHFLQSDYNPIGSAFTRWRSIRTTRIYFEKSLLATNVWLARWLHWVLGFLYC